MVALHRSLASYGAMLAAFIATALAVLLMAPVAMAETYEIAGVEYTSPDGWEAVELNPEQFASVGVTEYAAFAKEDGFAFVGFIPDESVAQIPAEELSQFEQMDTSVPELEQFGITVSASTYEGYPVIRFSTDRIVLNDVVYRLEYGVIFVNNEQATGELLVVLMMPASGELTENYAQTYKPLTEDTPYVIGPVQYTIPAGFVVVPANIFGLDIIICSGPDGMMYAFNLPMSLFAGSLDINDFFFSDSELKDIADQISQQFGGAETLYVTYTFLGMPTLAFEVPDAAQGMLSEPIYVGFTSNTHDNGFLITVLVQPNGSSFVADLLGSAALAPIETSTTSTSLLSTFSDEATGRAA